MIFSHVLYQLSYLGKVFAPSQARSRPYMRTRCGCPPGPRGNSWRPFVLLGVFFRLFIHRNSIPAIEPSAEIKVRTSLRTEWPKSVVGGLPTFRAQGTTTYWNWKWPLISHASPSPDARTRATKLLPSQAPCSALGVFSVVNYLDYWSSSSHPKAGMSHAAAGQRHCYTTRSER